MAYELQALLAAMGDDLHYGAPGPRWVVNIEFKGVVGNLEIVEVYKVPENDEYPPALHLVLKEADGVPTLVSLVEGQVVVRRKPEHKTPMKCLPLEQRPDMIHAVDWAATHRPHRLGKLRTQYERGILTDDEFTAGVISLSTYDKDL